ncbi:MAG: glucose 1-dehydrogenase [Anaerolineae bacterium]|nr:glucose 1-dehydrogenase [Anaerolineae bacterium]
MTTLTGKVALVTGASLGIGRACAERLAAAGADVIVNYRSSQDAAEEVAAGIQAMGRRALAIRADVSDRAAVEAMFGAALDRFGRLDLLVANVGYNVREPLVEADWETFRRVIEVNVMGAFHPVQLAAQRMVNQGEGGGIVFISSVHAEIPVARSGAYNLCKAGLNHYMDTLAVELAPHRIRVNTVNPGWIDTPGERKFMSEEEIYERAQALPWGRIGRADEVADAVVMLCSPQADYITGATLRVDGGFTAAWGQF